MSQILSSSSSSSSGMLDFLKFNMIANSKDSLIYSFIILALFEFFTGMLRDFLITFKTELKQYFDNKFKKQMESSLQTIRPEQSELMFYRIYKNTSDNWDKADSILDKLLVNNNSKAFLILGQLELIKNKKSFELESGVYFELIDFTINLDNTVDKLQFKIYSQTQDIIYLRNFVNKCLEDYLIKKKNNLGTKKYYFDHFVEKNRKGDTSPSDRIIFTKHVFETNRTLDNIYHERQDEIKDRVNFFLHRKDWYKSRGIPYTLGLLLYGEPGTGKTSTIKGVANVTERHIININLSMIKSKKLLKKLFYDERIEVCENTTNYNITTEYIIPIEKRVYVIEDIDALEGDLLLSRKNKIMIEKEEQIEYDKSGMEKNVSNGDIDLATVLNIIDGTLEIPGRILIISTNYPEKLDEALIRPGRIDLMIEFTKCSHKMIRDMFNGFFDYTCSEQELAQIPENVWTPAEVSNILFKNFSTPNLAIQSLIDNKPKDYFKEIYDRVDDPSNQTCLMFEAESFQHDEPAQNDEPRKTDDPAQHDEPRKTDEPAQCDEPRKTVNTKEEQIKQLVSRINPNVEQTIIDYIKFVEPDLPNDTIEKVTTRFKNDKVYASYLMKDNTSSSYTVLDNLADLKETRNPEESYDSSGYQVLELTEKYEDVYDINQSNDNKLTAKDIIDSFISDSVRHYV